MSYVPRNYLDDPADSPVWRYMNLEKLLSILFDHALFFASGSTLARDDKYEGQLTLGEINSLKVPLDALHALEEKYHQPVMQRLFFNCWHMNDGESDAMCKLYVDGTGGVAIRSNISRLKQCFHKSQEDMSLGRISYITDDSTGPHFDHMVRRYMRKKPAFKHEQEVRLVFYDEKQEYTGRTGIQIPIDVGILIEKVVVSPRAEGWFAVLVKKLITKLGHDIEVIPSEGSVPLPI
jgi:hypothetical protein